MGPVCVEGKKSPDRKNRRQGKRNDGRKGRFGGKTPSEINF